MLLGATLLVAEAGWATSAGRRTNSGPWRVLIIFSEGKDLPGNVLLEQALRTGLQAQAAKPVEFYTEHLDASRFSDEAHSRLFLDYLGAKYASQEPDLLMVVMARDFTLAERLPVKVFPNIPMVFLSFSELPAPESLNKPGIAGIIQHLDVRGTLLLAKQLQPETRRIMVIGGRSESDRRTLARFQEASVQMPNVEFEYWTNQPFKEAQARAQSLPKDSAIFVSTIFEDVTGQTIYLTYAAQMLAPVANAPIFSLSPGSIGNGAAGGAVVNPQRVGEKAARLALQMLERTPAKQGRIEESTSSTVMVDWRQLTRWNINFDLLPKECVVANRPRSLWEEHKRLISAVLAVMLAQGFTIAALVAQRARRRHAETEILRQRDELAHVARVVTMGQLASSLAHEINQPLGAILRNTEAAEMFLQAEKPDLEELKAILADIRKDDQRAGGVIDHMRSLLKKRNLDYTMLSLRELLEETVALARTDAQARHVRLILDAPGPLPEIHGDRVHLQQVLLNLILNGMDAVKTGANGERVVTVHAAATKDGGVEIAVSDCGCGIPPDKLGRVFEPFFTTKTEGLGMGLAISRTIVEAHGGKIAAENNAAKGATFRLTLPAKPGEV